MWKSAYKCILIQDIVFGTTMKHCPTFQILLNKLMQNIRFLRYHNLQAQETIRIKINKKLQQGLVISSHINKKA